MLEFWLVAVGKFFTPARILILGYLIVIAVGTTLLMLPVSTSSGEINNFIVALFTSTSAVCVTGLIVVDTATYYSTFGKTVILILIQIGGLGSMTAYALILFLLGRKLNIAQMLTLKAGLNLPGLGRLRQIVVVAVIASLIFETLGVLILLPTFYGRKPGAGGVFDAIFQSVSAFNNAGFSTFSDNLASFSSSAVAIIAMNFLVIIGGLGFLVLLDLYECYVLRKRQDLALHSKAVLLTTVILLIFGFVVFLLTEWNNPATLGNSPLGEKILHGLSMSVFPRTAGFNTVNYANIGTATLILTLIMMMIGASPGGTGGGCKTTSFLVIISSILNLFKGKAGTVILRRKIPAKVLLSAFSLVAIWSASIAIFAFIFSLYEPFPLRDVVFEVASALGTVGLSRGITASLSYPSQIVLMILMIAGRVGPITAGATVFHATSVDRLHYPEEEVLVG